MNPTHHEEQMEAYRRDFKEYYRDTIKPILEEFKVLNSPAIEHVCWNCFLKGGNPPPDLG